MSALKPEITKLNEDTQLRAAKATNLLVRDFEEYLSTYDKSCPKERAIAFGLFTELKRISPGLETKDKDAQPTLVINVDRLPGVSKALSRPKSDPLLTLDAQTGQTLPSDAPEPRFGASEVSADAGKALRLEDEITDAPIKSEEFHDPLAQIDLDAVAWGEKAPKTPPAQLVELQPLPVLGELDLSFDA